MGPYHPTDFSPYLPVNGYDAANHKSCYSMDLGTVKKYEKRPFFIFNAVSDPAGGQAQETIKC
jgi:hypothetical protein